MDRPLFAYCPGCGTPEIHKRRPKEYHCPACGYHFFWNAAAAAGAILRCGDELLFGVRAREPARGAWDLVGGFIDFGESAEHGLAREIREELGLDVAPEQMRYFCSLPNTYTFDNITYNTLDLIYVCELPERPEVRPADDLADVAWAPIASADYRNLGFVSTQEAVRRYLEAERGNRAVFR